VNVLIGFCRDARAQYGSAPASFTPAQGGSMIFRRHVAAVLLGTAFLLLAGCATLQGTDPPQVTVAGIEPLQGEGMELRLLVKLRVQNPNDAAINYNGVALEMNVQGKTFASGVSDESGSVPRFGESVITVPVTISAFRMIRQAVGMMHGGGAGMSKISYEMKGKLSTSAFTAARFQTKGEFDLPAAGAAPEA
jgi:LEA14-like dessication related protein